MTLGSTENGPEVENPEEPKTSSETRIYQIGDFEIDEGEPLGAGTYGNVFKARNVKDGTPVAVKKINKCVLMNKIELERVQKMGNPNIVQYYDVIFEEDATYVIMNLCDTDLAKHIDKWGKLTDENLITVANNIASAYLSVAEEKILHRDIKSCNILLTYENPPDNDTDNQDNTDQPRIKIAQLTDFGCSRTGENVRKESAVLAGTPLYMAPECGANLVHKNAYTQAIDMWSIGCVLFEVSNIHNSATGKLPFTDQQLCRIFLRAANPSNCSANDAPDPGELPGQIRPVIRALLSISPIDRPNAMELYDSLVKQIPYEELSHLHGQGSTGSLNTKRKSIDSKNGMKRSSSSQTLKRIGSWIRCLGKTKENPKEGPQSARNGTMSRDDDSYDKLDGSKQNGS